MSERFLVRTSGGPHPGSRVATSDFFPWPLPQTLPDDGGRYVKVSESTLPPMGEDSHLLRGADYDWQPDEPFPGAA